MSPSEYEPIISFRPWVVYDGTTSEVHPFATRAEADVHAQHLIEESHDYETWDEGVEETFVALIVAKAVEVPLTDDKSNYQLCEVEVAVDVPIVESLMVEMQAILDTAKTERQP